METFWNWLLKAMFILGENPMLSDPDQAHACKALERLEFLVVQDIFLTETAKLRNDHPDVVIDGGGLVTLSGGGTTRILYLNTSDQAQVWTTSHAQNQDHPHLSVQNLTFADGLSPEPDGPGVGGGGAIYD